MTWWIPRLCADGSIDCVVTARARRIGGSLVYRLYWPASATDRQGDGGGRPPIVFGCRLFNDRAWAIPRNVTDPQGRDRVHKQIPRPCQRGWVWDNRIAGTARAVGLCFSSANISGGCRQEQFFPGVILEGASGWRKIESVRTMGSVLKFSALWIS